MIGAGQLGSRHLQSLSRINKLIDISVVDPNQESLKTAKKTFQEMPANEFVRSVNYLDSLQLLDKAVDVAIIACNADVRRGVVEDLLEQVEVKYIILEKVVAQSIEDFIAVMTLLEKKGIKAWVNCNKRTFPFFRELQKELEPEILYMVVEGGKWGLATNTIHFLDLFSFFTGENDFTVNPLDLDKNVYNSKRNRFIELGGQLAVKTSRGDSLILKDDKESNLPVVIYISSQNNRYIIDMNNLKVYIQIKKNNGWVWEESYFSLPHMSDMTYLTVQQIFNTGESDLASLAESFALHKPMIEAFNEHLTRVTGKKYIKCPIT